MAVFEEDGLKLLLGRLNRDISIGDLSMSVNLAFGDYSQSNSQKCSLITKFL